MVWEKNETKKGKAMELLLTLTAISVWASMMIMVKKSDEKQKLQAIYLTVK